MQSNSLEFFISVYGATEGAKKFFMVQKAVNSAKNEVDNLSKASVENAKASDVASGATDRVTKSTERAAKAHNNYGRHIIWTTILSAGVNKAFLEVVDSMGQAIKQIDLIDSFPASMGALGLSVDDASKSFAVLKTYVQSVGGDLTAAASTVSRFAGVTKNVKAAVAEYAGLNNALIAGGTSSEVQASALEQLTQAYSRGAPQAIEWKSAMVAMSPQLQQVAKAMGLVNATALGDALTTGEIKMQDFMTKLTEMSTGTGPIAQQALVRMQGIEFAGNVMKNALVNGLTAIYQAVGKQNIVNTLNTITQAIGILFSWIVALINGFISLANIIIGLFGGNKISQIVGDSGSAVSDLGQTMDDTTESAKDLKKQLASFDKMNVLSDKSNKGTSSTGPSPLSLKDAQKLSDITDSLSKKIEEAGTGAKIFASILAGIATLLVSEKIISWFKTASTVSLVTKAISGLGKGIATVAGIGWKFTSSLAKGLFGIGSGGNGIFGDAANFGAKIGLKIRDGVKTSIEAAKDIGSVLWDKIKTGAGHFKTLAKIAWEDITTGVGKVYTQAKGLADVAWSNIKTGASSIADMAKIGWAKLAAGISTAATSLWGMAAALLANPITWIVLGVIALIAAIVWLIMNWELVKKVAIDTWNNISAVWGEVSKWFDDNVIKPVAKFFSGLWDGIATIFGIVGKWFGDRFSEAWNAIATAFGVVGTWFMDNVWNPIATLFGAIGKWFGDRFREAWNGITLVFGIVGTWFMDNVWNPIVSVFSGVGKWFSDVFSAGWKAITDVFSNVQTWFTNNVVNKIGEAFGGLIDILKGIFKTVINWIIDNIFNNVINLINGMIKGVNSISGVIGIRFGEIPKIPRLAQGAIATKSTLVNVGEAGKEAILPLDNNTGWMDDLAAKLGSSGNGQPINLTIQIGEDKIVNKVINMINEKSQMSGRNTILV